MIRDFHNRLHALEGRLSLDGKLKLIVVLEAQYNKETDAETYNL